MPDRRLDEPSTRKKIWGSSRLFARSQCSIVAGYLWDRMMANGVRSGGQTTRVQLCLRDVPAAVRPWAKEGTSLGLLLHLQNADTRSSYSL